MKRENVVNSSFFASPLRNKKKLVWIFPGINKFSYADGVSWWMGFCGGFYTRGCVGNFIFNPGNIHTKRYSVFNVDRELVPFSRKMKERVERSLHISYAGYRLFIREHLSKTTNTSHIRATFQFFCHCVA